MKNIVILIVVTGFITGCSGNKSTELKELEFSDSLEIEELEPAQVSEVPILMYHYVREVDKVADPLGWNLSISPEYFEMQLAYLKDQGYQSVHLSELLDGEVSENAIVLSFDDGLSDFYSNALPLLEEYGFTATNAVITGKIGTNVHMTKDEIAECIEAGIEIVSHSVNHPDLRQLNEDEKKNELDESKNYLEKEFGIEVESFVFPAGNYDELVVDALRETGYSLALTTVHGLADLNGDLLLLPRIRVDNRDAFDGFVKKIEAVKNF